jgi:hypothetical protein
MQATLPSVVVNQFRILVYLPVIGADSDRSCAETSSQSNRKRPFPFLSVQLSNGSLSTGRNW